ncbi:hypothetical protein HYX16_00155 [Candidatus Woesearchaeota archaeon]|nr:hypothetical protein [Candidatus Woesearchaeota archaeon]
MKNLNEIDEEKNWEIMMWRQKYHEIFSLIVFLTLVITLILILIKEGFPLP